MIPFILSAQSRGSRTIEFGNVSVIEIAPNGNVWVGSISNGCSGFTAATTTWATFNTQNTLAMKSDSLTAIALYPVGGVPHSFMGTTNGIAYKHGNAWDTLSNLVHPRIVDIVKSPEHNLYVATQAGVSIFNDTTLVHQSDLTTSNSNIPSTDITCLQTKSLTCTGFYAGTADTGFFFTNDLTNFTHRTAANFSLVDNRVNCLFVEPSCNTIYVGTKGGLSIFDNIASTNYTVVQGLAENDVTAIEKDCHGDIWIGTRNSGISIFNGTNFTSFTTADGLPSNSITSISFKTGICEAFIGTLDGGMAQLDTNRNVVQLFNNISSVEDQIAVSISPQPAGSYIAINLGFEPMKATVQITDIQGKIVVTHELDSSRQTIDVSALSTGIYLYNITDSNKKIKPGKISVLHH
jgi:ligand-binding sensor domain-containing protein